jgi:hypothetical protein
MVDVVSDRFHSDSHQADVWRAWSPFGLLRFAMNTVDRNTDEEPASV